MTARAYTAFACLARETLENAGPVESVQPFPFASLPAVSRAGVELGRRLREAVAIAPLSSEVGAALSELAGEPVTVTLRQTTALDAARVRPDALGTILVPPDAVGLRGGILILGEGALAAGLVSRALRQRAPRIVDPSRLPPAVAGAFAATVHAVVRRTSPTPWRVAAAGPAAVLARDLGATSARVLHADVVVTVGGDTFDAGIVLAAESLPAERTLRLEELASDATPMALPLVVATCLASRAELGSLAHGDVLVVPGLALGGDVALIAPRSEVGLAASLADDGTLVVRKRAARRPWDRRLADEEPANMTENPTLEALEDAPVVVRVELGVVEMPAHAWAALADGDVLPLGRKLGAPAVLRVGGVAVAQGELVQIEGEYGIRIRRGETR